MKSRSYFCEGCDKKCRLKIDLHNGEIPLFCLMHAPNYFETTPKWRRSRVARGAIEALK
jgi:hypothetical protein